MKRIFYVNGSVITGNKTAEIVLAYAQALANSEGSDTIDIPVLGDHGETARAQLLIGPASQLMVVSQTAEAPELDDLEAIERIEKKISGLNHPESQPVDLGSAALADPDAVLPA